MIRNGQVGDWRERDFLTNFSLPSPSDQRRSIYDLQLCPTAAFSINFVRLLHERVVAKIGISLSKFTIGQQDTQIRHEEARNKSACDLW